MIADKQCIKCGETKPLTEFYESIRDKDGYRGVCKICWANYAKQYRLTEQGKIKTLEASRRFWGKSNKAIACRERYRQSDALKNYHKSDVYQTMQNRLTASKYGITIAEYDVMFEQQEGNCAICGLPEITRRLCIDHDHKTGEVRALLCNGCNLLVGVIEERSEILSKAIEYVNKYGLSRV